MSTTTAPDVAAHLSETGGRIIITADGETVRQVANTCAYPAGTWLAVTRDHLGCVRIEASDTDRETVTELAAECSAWCVWAVAVQLSGAADT